MSCSMVLNGISFPGRLYHSNQTSHIHENMLPGATYSYNTTVGTFNIQSTLFKVQHLLNIHPPAPCHCQSCKKKKGYGLIRNQHSTAQHCSVWNIPSFAIKTTTVTASTGKCSLSTQHSSWKSRIIHANQAACKAALRMTLVGDRCWGGNNMSPVTCR